MDLLIRLVGLLMQQKRQVQILLSISLVYLHC